MMDFETARKATGEMLAQAEKEEWTGDRALEALENLFPDDRHYMTIQRAVNGVLDLTGPETITGYRRRTGLSRKG